MLNYSLFDEHPGSGSRFTYALHTPEQQERFLADLKQEHLLVAQGAQINYLNSTLQTPLDLLNNTPLAQVLRDAGALTGPEFSQKHMYFHRNTYRLAPQNGCSQELKAHQ